MVCRISSSEKNFNSYWSLIWSMHYTVRIFVILFSQCFWNRTYSGVRKLWR